MLLWLDTQSCQSAFLCMERTHEERKKIRCQNQIIVTSIKAPTKQQVEHLVLTVKSAYVNLPLVIVKKKKGFIFSIFSELLLFIWVDFFYQRLEIRYMSYIMSNKYLQMTISQCDCNAIKNTDKSETCDVSLVEWQQSECGIYSTVRSDTSHD